MVKQSGLRNMMLSALFLLLLKGCCTTWADVLTVQGEVGGEVTIPCSHINAFSNVKYFCKGECRDEDVLVRSKKNEVNFNASRRFSISDKGNEFFITIKDLRLGDTGQYYCGIDRIWPDTFVKVYLQVNNATSSRTSFPTVIIKVVESDVPAVKVTTTAWLKPTEPTTEDESTQGERVAGNLSFPVLYIGAALGVALLVLVLLIFCWLKRRGTSVCPSDKKHSTNECRGNQRRARPMLASLSNQHQDSSFYANVSVFPKPPLQPDGSASVPSSPEQPGDFYSTVQFHPKSVALHTDAESVTYSIVKTTQLGPG